jgi:hypothetical protein
VSKRLHSSRRLLTPVEYEAAVVHHHEAVAVVRRTGSPQRTTVVNRLDDVLSWPA